MSAILSQSQSINQQEKDELNNWNLFSIKDPFVYILQVNCLRYSCDIWWYSSRSTVAEEMVNITWINVDLSKDTLTSTAESRLKLTYRKFNSNRRAATELITWVMKNLS